MANNLYLPAANNLGNNDGHNIFHFGNDIAANPPGSFTLNIINIRELTRAIRLKQTQVTTFFNNYREDLDSMLNLLSIEFQVNSLSKFTSIQKKITSTKLMITKWSSAFFVKITDIYNTMLDYSKLVQNYQNLYSSNVQINTLQTISGDDLIKINVVINNAEKAAIKIEKSTASLQRMIDDLNYWLTLLSLGVLNNSFFKTSDKFNLFSIFEEAHSGFNNTINLPEAVRARLLEMTNRPYRLNRVQLVTLNEARFNDEAVNLHYRPRYPRENAAFLRLPPLLFTYEVIDPHNISSIKTLYNTVETLRVRYEANADQQLLDQANLLYNAVLLQTEILINRYREDMPENKRTFRSHKQNLYDFLSYVLFEPLVDGTINTLLSQNTDDYARIYIHLINSIKQMETNEYQNDNFNMLTSDITLMQYIIKLTVNLFYAPRPNNVARVFTIQDGRNINIVNGEDIEGYITNYNRIIEANPNSIDVKYTSAHGLKILEYIRRSNHNRLAFITGQTIPDDFATEYNETLTSLETIFHNIQLSRDSKETLGSYVYKMFKYLQSKVAPNDNTEINRHQNRYTYFDSIAIESISHNVDGFYHIYLIQKEYLLEMLHEYDRLDARIHDGAGVFPEVALAANGLRII